MAKERLQKILAQAGVASRRAAEALIANGDVRVNGRIVTELGVRADAAHDRIEVKGERIVAEKPAYYVLNKPREVVTTLSDPEGRATIADLLKRVPERVYPVGRLDYHTSGVLLLTNDGELAQSLLHPTRGVPKAYVVKVRGQVPLPKIEALRNGVVLDDGQRTKPAELFIVRDEKNSTWLQITITEGRNRQIHRMCEAMGLVVMRLSRVAFAGLTAEGLRPGDYRELSQKELAKLDRDYRNPATRKRVDEARIKRYADAGFEFGDVAVVRAPRGPRRGAASTFLAAAKEAKEAPRAKPARPARGKKTFGKRTDAAASSTAQRGQRGLFQKRTDPRGDQRTDAAFSTAQKGQRGRFQKRADPRGDQRTDAALSTAQKGQRGRFQKRPDPRGDKRTDAALRAPRKDPRSGPKKRMGSRR
jgi:23S rRNA pseudouridine2605 synthase